MIYWCACGPECKCNTMSLKPGKCACGKEMVGGHVVFMEGNTALACTCPVLLAPAMNTHMLENQAVTDNLMRLKSRGVEIIEAAEGLLANCETGKGRLPDAETIYRHCLRITCV